MITRAPRRSHAVQQVSTEVVLGSTSKALGRLVFVKDGQREFSQFAFESDWLSDAQYFDISPDLNRLAGFQLTKPQGRSESSFFLALADTAPDAWGRRVIARAHAKSRAGNPSLGPLTEFDYLASVDDFSRIGALRLRDEQGHFLRSASDGERSTPTILELEKILAASRAVELSQETAEDLAYLQGKATSLGGMRPKCTTRELADFKPAFRL
jgi:serine/threonine-protein kinase HipA